MNVGISGEFRCVVTTPEGDIKTDTGYQKNLILNQGLDFFGGGMAGTFDSKCVIGAGNLPPEETQTKLESFVALATLNTNVRKYSYVDEGDEKYKPYDEGKYRFEGLGSVNISELGLASSGTQESNYLLMTRALIKDTSGSPTTISVKEGETLDIFYRVYKVISMKDEVYQINLLDGEGGSEPYNVTIRPAVVGRMPESRVSIVVNPLTINPTGLSSKLHFKATDLDLATASPTKGVSVKTLTGRYSISDYVSGSYSRVVTLELQLDDVNLDEGFRSLTTFAGDDYGDPWLPFTQFQARYGSVSDDSPIFKTSKDKLTLPFEISWGRAEEEV